MAFGNKQVRQAHQSAGTVGLGLKETMLACSKIRVDLIERFRTIDPCGFQEAIGFGQGWVGDVAAQACLNSVPRIGFEVRPWSGLRTVVRRTFGTDCGVSPAAFFTDWLTASTSIRSFGEHSRMSHNAASTSIERRWGGWVTRRKTCSRDSTTPPHTFIAGGRRLYTWCVADALMFPAVLGSAARIESRCPTTDAAIRLAVDPKPGSPTSRRSQR
jgi:Alkylmercury lyase